MDRFAAMIILLGSLVVSKTNLSSVRVVLLVDLTTAIPELGAHSPVVLLGCPDLLLLSFEPLIQPLFVHGV